jgi:hypothetical protein
MSTPGLLSAHSLATGHDPYLSTVPIMAVQDKALSELE